MDQAYEFMEMDDDDLRSQGLPNVDILKGDNSKPISIRQLDFLNPYQLHMPNQPPREQISLFKKQQQPIQLLQQPAEEEFFIHLPNRQVALDIKPIRKQQTHEPVCPNQDQDYLPGANGFCLRVEHGEIGAAGDSEVFEAPSLEGFDDLPDPEVSFEPIPVLSAEEVELTLTQSISFVPPTPSEGEMYELAPSVPLIQEEKNQFCFRNLTSQPSIRLMSCSSNGENDENIAIYHELMDDEECETGGAARCEHDLPPTRVPTSKERKTASYILDLHQELAKDVHQAKKKPMLHEFLGYILYLGGKNAELALLRHSIYFCDEAGERQSAPREHFRVANFQTVSEVWKLIKCNSSKDCTKNMKRAMRMSTSNDRNYFVNLSQRMHRMQVFKFGQKSMDYFKKMFPSSF